MDDPELGTLDWDQELESWEGSAVLSSETPFRLYVLARAAHTPGRAITDQARRSIARLREAEAASRNYAAGQLLDIYNSEWSEGKRLSREAFIQCLFPESIVVHEDGYAELHFNDGGLFWGHSVGVRITSDGSFQEAVVEG